MIYLLAIFTSMKRRRYTGFMCSIPSNPALSMAALWSFESPRTMAAYLLGASVTQWDSNIPPHHTLLVPWIYLLDIQSHPGNLDASTRCFLRSFQSPLSLQLTP
uniref:Uncharacterized protein n=1 Tax=Arundo donax TaxID=35708 RepID=A0A0A9EWQ5_ARUDO